jgi:hypothetical protein
VRFSESMLIFAGISLEISAAFPAITAVGKGFDAVAIDAFSETFVDCRQSRNWPIEAQIPQLGAWDRWTDW